MNWKLAFKQLLMTFSLNEKWCWINSLSHADEFYWPCHYHENNFDSGFMTCSTIYYFKERFDRLSLNCRNRHILKYFSPATLKRSQLKGYDMKPPEELCGKQTRNIFLIFCILMALCHISSIVSLQGIRRFFKKIGKS